MSLTRNGEAPQIRQDGDLRPIAWRWRQCRLPWHYSEREPEGPFYSAADIEVQPLYGKPTYLLEHIDDTKDKFKLHYPKEPRRF